MECNTYSIVQYKYYLLFDKTSPISHQSITSSKNYFQTHQPKIIHKSQSIPPQYSQSHHSNPHPTSIIHPQHIQNNNNIMIAKLGSFTRLLFRASGIKSVPGHRPPRKEDNPSGRYAGSLFSAASEKQHLDVVQDDLDWLGKLVKQSTEFKSFLTDVSVQKPKQKQFLETVVSNSFSPTTKEFLNILVDTGRLNELPKIIEKFDQYVKILSKQQDIRIISAKELNESEKKQVQNSLSKGRPGVQFKVQYEVDPSIIGGLQAYSGSTFLDCSLRSRLDKLKTELQKL